MLTKSATNGVMKMNYSEYQKSIARNGIPFFLTEEQFKLTKDEETAYKITCDLYNDAFLSFNEALTWYTTRG